MSPESLKIVVGTRLQERIVRQLLTNAAMASSHIVSLDEFYQFGLDMSDLSDVVTLRSSSRKAWYKRSKAMKLASLPEFIGSFLMAVKGAGTVVFFVDTGVLERAAIWALRFIGVKTVVLQDAMKRRPKAKKNKSIEWFGGGGADLYLLCGEAYRDMVKKGEVRIVGAPIENARPPSSPPGATILVVNQCFALYGEISEHAETTFMRDIVEIASRYGPVELRLHPNNNPELYRDFSTEGVTVTQTKPLADSLRGAGLVLAVNSTVILDALAAGRPVATLDWHPSPFEQPIKAARSCRDSDALLELLEEWSRGELLSATGEAIEDELSRFVAQRGNAAICAVGRALSEPGPSNSLHHPRHRYTLG